MIKLVFVAALLVAGSTAALAQSASYCTGKCGGQAGPTATNSAATRACYESCLNGKPAASATNPQKQRRRTSSN